MVALILLQNLLVRDKAERFPQFVLGSCLFLLYFLLNVAEFFMLRWGKGCIWEKEPSEDHRGTTSGAERPVLNFHLWQAFLTQCEQFAFPWIASALRKWAYLWTEMLKDYINLCGVLRHGTLSTWINGWQPRLGNLLVAFFQLRFLGCFLTCYVGRHQDTCCNH